MQYHALYNNSMSYLMLTSPKYAGIGGDIINCGGLQCARPHGASRRRRRRLRIALPPTDVLTSVAAALLVAFKSFVRT